LVSIEGHYPRAKKAAGLAFAHMRSAHDQGRLRLSDKELMWLDRLSETVEDMPYDADELTESMFEQCEKLDPKKYDL
nr:methyltransferase MtaB domain-containing protein [Clostridia bacterium]